MNLGRKGITYTFVSLVLLLIIGAMFFSQSRVGSREAQQAAATRVKAVNAFIYNLEADTERAAYIAGFRALIAMEQQVTSTGAFITDPEDVFKEVFLSGNISGTPFQIMSNSTFDEYLLRVEQEAAKQGIMFNVTVNDVRLWQSDPWNVLVNYTLDMNITDARGTASWEIQRSFIGTVPITDLRDPLFAVFALGKIQRVIKRTNVSELVDDAGDANDTTNLVQHLNNSRYIAAGRGPSILMRFSGNFSDSVFGVESLVDVEDFSAQGLTIYSARSVVDYKYFDGVDADACNIQNMPLIFKLDTSSLTTYEIQGELDYVVC